jgi:hypothetical protein
MRCSKLVLVLCLALTGCQAVSKTYTGEVTPMSMASTSADLLA